MRCGSTRTCRSAWTSIDDLKAGDGDVLVRIHAAGVCGTDLHILDGMIKPDVVSHDARPRGGRHHRRCRGRVSLAAGTPVAIYNKIFCGRCEQCLKGRTNICDNEPEQLGFNRDGGDAEYVVVPEQNVVRRSRRRRPRDRIRPHLRRHDRGARRRSSPACDWGHGGRRRHRRRRHHRRAGGRARGCAGDRDRGLGGEARSRHGRTERPTACSSPTPESYDEVPDRIRALTSGRGTDVFFELVGTTQTMNAGIRSLAKGGRFVSTGYTDQMLQIHPIEFILPETSLVSTVAATRLDLQDALILASTRRSHGPDRRAGTRSRASTTRWSASQAHGARPTGAGTRLARGRRDTHGDDDLRTAGRVPEPTTAPVHRGSVRRDRTIRSRRSTRRRGRPSRRRHSRPSVRSTPR